MTDRELLELAAKACGLEEAKMRIEFSQWNPLTDDGDALRLAVKMQIIVGKYDYYANAGAIGSDVDVVVWDHEEKCPYAATRRAITRAAAEIGRNMK